MEAFEDTIVARPALKRLQGLLRDGVEAAPSDVYRALQRDDLSEALKAANRRWSKRGARDLVGAITYATLLVVRELLDEARGVLDRAQKEHPEAPALQVLEGERLLLLGRPEDGREVLERIDLFTVDSPGVASMVGDLLLDLGLDDDAVAAYGRAVDMGSRDIEVAIRLAQLSLDGAEIERAAESFERAAKIAGDRVGLWEAAADAWFQLGEDSRGLRAYERVLELEPSGAQDWLQHGLALARTGEASAAEQALERCVDMNPFDIDAWVTLGQVRMQQGRAEAALPAFEHALEQRDDDIDALLGVVSAALVIGDLRLAEEVARRAVSVLPDDPEAHHSLGVTLQEMGRHSDSLEALQRAVEIAEALEMPATNYRTSLALARLASGEVEDALAEVEAVMGEAPAEEGLALEFAEGLIRAGAFDEARAFMASHGQDTVLEKLVSPVFAFVMAAYRGEDADDEAQRALDAARRHAAALPVDWDFQQLERLSLRMDREDKRRFSDIVAVLEGRKPPTNA
jgi:tetratricopeptide (TPR) repeat protein